MEAFTMENGWTIKLKDMGSMCGLMADNLLALGKLTICMGKDFTHGKMAESTKENI